MSVIVNGKYPDENNRIQLTSQDINMSYSDNISVYNKIGQLQQSVNSFNDTLGIIVGNNNYITINDKINNIYTTKASIATSIINKGVKMPQTTPFQRYSEYIDKIQGVKPPQQQEEEEQIKYLVRFIDYDGTVLKQESVLEGGSVTAPQLPSHKNLVFFGWNNSFEKVYNDLQIGAIYNTVSNKCYFELQIQHNGDDAFISFNVEKVLSTVGGNIVINWGDSIVTSENIKLDQTGIFYFKHTYSSKDIYQIVVEFNNLNVSFNRNCFCDYEKNLNYNYQLLSAKIGNKITKINASAFNNCYRLRRVSLPNGMKQISNFSFQNCYMLENINFPVTLTVLGKSVFNYCKSLQKITFPNGINSIGDNCFFGCSQLQKIVLILKNKGCELGQYLFGNCLQLKNVIYSVNKIPPYCFYQCYSLQNFLNLISIISIGNNSFQQCTQLKNISLYVTQIPFHCFYNCYSLQNIKINNKITSVGSSAFYNCNALENIKFNYGVSEIGESAFESCTNLKTIDLRSGLSSIGNRAFYNCDSLQKITMSYENTSLERNQFRFSESTTIGSSAFYKCMSLRDLKITCLLSDGNYGNVSIGTNCFNNCINLQSFELKANNVTLGEGSFQNCYELSLLNIEGNFKKYENRLLYNCKNLKEITIKQSITEIGEEVFVGCYSLQTVNVQGKTPAIIVQNSYDVNNIFCIYVPNSSYSNYKKVWSYVEDKIIGNLTEEEQMNTPLTFFAQEVGATVKFEKIGEYDISNFLWRRGDGIDDGIGWLPYEFGTQINVSGVNEKGQKVESVQFCSSNSFLSMSEQKYVHCVTKGKVSCYGNVLSLINNTAITKQYCFYALFKDCTNLTTMPIFKSTFSSSYCCKSMFERCTSLIQTKRFGVNALSNNCFEYMFKGCTSLIENKGVLISSILSDYCYHGMFQGCIKLKNIYDFSFDNASTSCCQRMFYGCANLIADVDLIIKSFALNSYKQMFENCKNLKTNVVFITNDLYESCCQRMFYESGVVKTPSNFSFNALPKDCFKEMFYGCESLQSIPQKISSVGEFGTSCCESMFEGCLSIKYQPIIESEIIGERSCYGMFKGCKNLTETNDIMTDKLSKQSFESMFEGCESITTLPFVYSLNEFVIDFSTWSFSRMFYGCNGLTNLNYNIFDKLIQKTEEGCYYSMFENCKNMTGFYQKDNELYSIELRSDELSHACYCSMFKGCSSLTSVMYLAFTTPAAHCCESMFEECESLKETMPLNAEDTKDYCYASMFKDCVSLTHSSGIMCLNNKQGQLSKGCCKSMFEGCSSLKEGHRVQVKYYGVSSCEAMYRNCTSLTTVSANGTELWQMKLDYDVGKTAKYAFASMYEGCSSLRELPKLTSEKTSDYCYYSMFKGCSSLTTTVQQLPSTALSEYCYASMFEDCINIGSATQLPATELKPHCYQKMFKGCSSLVYAPHLPAETLVDQCYSYMFSGCSNLSKISTKFKEWLGGEQFSPDPSAAEISGTRNWVEGVNNEQGLFIRNQELKIISPQSVIDYITYLYGVSRIPNGWTIQPPLLRIQQKLCEYMKQKQDFYEDSYFWHEDSTNTYLIYNYVDNTDYLYKNFDFIEFYVDDYDNEIYASSPQMTKTIKIDLSSLDFENYQYKLDVTGGDTIDINKNGFFDYEMGDFVNTVIDEQNNYSCSIQNNILVYNLLGTQEISFNVLFVDKYARRTKQILSEQQIYNIPVSYDTDGNVEEIRYFLGGSEFETNQMIYKEVYYVTSKYDQNNQILSVSYIVGNSGTSYNVIKSTEGNYVYDIVAQMNENSEYLPVIYKCDGIKEQVTEVISDENGNFYYNIPVLVNEISYNIGQQQSVSTKQILESNGSFYYDIPVDYDSNGDVLQISYNDGESTYTTTSSIEISNGNYVYDIMASIKQISYQNIVKRGTTVETVGDDYYNIPIVRDEYGNILEVSYELPGESSSTSEYYSIYLYNIPVSCDMEGNVEEIRYSIGEQSGTPTILDPQPKSSILSSIKGNYTSIGKQNGRIILSKIAEKEFE